MEYRLLVGKRASLSDFQTEWRRKWHLNLWDDGTTKGCGNDGYGTENSKHFGYRSACYSVILCWCLTGVAFKERKVTYQIFALVTYPVLDKDSYIVENKVHNSRGDKL